MNPEVPNYLQKIHVSNATIKVSQEEWDQIFKPKRKNATRKTDLKNRKTEDKHFVPNGF